MQENDSKSEWKDYIRQVVCEELKLFRENEIDPLRRQIEELTSRLNQDHTSLDYVPRNSNGGPFSHQRSGSFYKSPNNSSSTSIFHRVGSKVASTTSSLLHGSSSTEGPDFNALVHDLSPSHSPVSLTNENLISGTANAASSALAGVNDIGGPVTVRRNSGVTRVTDTHEPLSDVVIPVSLQEGLPFLRITHNKKVQRVLRIDKDAGIISWNTKQSSRLLIDRICEIYVGEEARNYREEFKISSEHSQRWATIIHQRPKETKLRALHLIISNQQDFDMFIASLFQLVKFRREIMSGLALAGRHFVDVHWNLNSASSEHLSFSQVLKLSRQLHIHCSRHYIRSIFDQADKDHSHYLNFEEFQEFVRLLKYRADIAAIYEQFKIGESAGSLINFFENVQHDQLPSFVQLPLAKLPTVDEFTQMLLSTLHAHSSSTNSTSQERDIPDLSLPMNNYFISSSHNTYLMGRQVADGSSIESCIRALQDGCRCLELDCWDGAANSSSSPVVYHGSGLARLTTSVVFSDVIEAVLKYAFISTPFPLILSLEIRCNESSQLRIVSILKTILARHLVTEPLPEDDGINLPSPNALKHRILVKVKSSSASVDYSSEESSISQESLSKPASTSINPALAELGVYFSGHRFPGIFTGNEYRNTVYSFNERTVKGMAKDNRKLETFCEYNKQHLSRVYPAPLRLSSSNFDPIYFWKKGVQMVALNWQTFDLGMQLNTAFFSNRVGYVLKPRSLRSSDTWHFDAESAEEEGMAAGIGHLSLANRALDRKGMRKLQVTIVSAQQLPRPKHLKDNNTFSPYVTLEAFGIDANDSLGLAPQWTTPAVFDNGFNPIWNYKCTIYINPEDFEFACLRFTLVAEGQPFAYHCSRVANMHPGYRHVQLVDLYGEDFIFSSLFIKSELSKA